MSEDGTIAGDGWIVAQRLQCRIAELEAEVARLSRQYSELAHAAWYAPLDEALTATRASGVHLS